jgi:hypothetical protein
MRGLFVLTLALGGPPALAQPTISCDGTPDQAVRDLPAPLNQWATIVCTPFGHIISGRSGWLWTHPGSYSPVFVPSQMVREHPAELGNQSYFTSIGVTPISGAEFEGVYSVFLTGMDRDENLPRGYRLDVTSVSGKALRLYLFDYSDSAWGIWCNTDCKPESRFMILKADKNP